MILPAIFEPAASVADLPTCRPADLPTCQKTLQA
jgi:hypothetical protein